jgi:hypothetical protein
MLELHTGDKKAEELGFTAELFRGTLVYDHIHKTIYVCFISSHEKRKGHTRKLLRNWIISGYRVKIVNPGQELEKMAIRRNWIPGIEIVRGEEEIVWTSPKLF